MTKPVKFPVEPLWQLLILDMGLNPADVLKAAQLPPDVFERKPAYITIPEYFRLWCAVGEATGDPAFPLKLVQKLSADAFMPPLYAALCSSSFLVAAERLVTHKRLLGPMVMRVDKTSELVTISFDDMRPEHPVPHSYFVMELVFMAHLIRIGTRQEVVPLEIITAEEVAGLEEYIEYWRIAPTLGSCYSITFSYADASLPFLTANQAVVNALESEFRKRITEIEADETFACRIRNLLLEALPSGEHSIDKVRKKMGVSRRTLQRRLSDEGTSFQTELNSVREGLALHYLTNTELPGIQIAFLLGYDDPNSFYRAFNRWTGVSSEEFRSAL